MPRKTKIIGAEQETLRGPGVLTHEGGDPILIGDVEGGIASGAERSLVFEGSEEIIDGDDMFTPVDADSRSTEVGEASLIRALGQANYSFTAKKEAEKVAA